MLNVYFGKKKDVIFFISDVFDEEFEKEWFDIDMVKEIILDIDKSVSISNGIIDSPYLGLITPKDLSTGTKTLILMLCDENLNGRYFDGDFMGDNCMPWLYKISQIKDINITLTNIPSFREVENEKGFEITIENDG